MYIIGLNEILNVVRTCLCHCKYQLTICFYRLLCHAVHHLYSWACTRLTYRSAKGNLECDVRVFHSIQSGETDVTSFISSQGVGEARVEQHKTELSRKVN